MNYFWAFCVGGGICVVGPAAHRPHRPDPGPASSRVMWWPGLVLSAIGWYAPLAEFAGCGATVPLLGFGHLLAKGGCAPHWRKRSRGILTGGASLPLRPALPPALCAAWCAPGWARATTRTEKTA